MAPKKRKQVAERPRAQRTVERLALPKERPAVKAGKDVCGACLLPMEPGARVGAVDNCSHMFHYECVERWSNTENTCPQCKVRFFWLASYGSDGRRLTLTKVENRDQEAEEEEDFDDVQVCEMCKEVGDEGTLLLCDGMHGTCNAAYHFRCVGLRAVPRVSWFCPDCSERGFDTDATGRRGRDLHALAGEDPAEGAEAPSSAPAPGVPAKPVSVPAAAAGRAAIASASGACASSAGASDGASASGASVNGRSGDALPPQPGLSSRARATPAVEDRGRSGPSAPAGLAGAPGSQAGGLFATFAQRRQMRRAAQAGLQARDSAASSEAGFIKLNPTYEEDEGFMAGKPS